MAHISKRFKKIRESVQQSVPMNVLDAFELLQKVSSVKFVESVDVSVNLGIDVKKSEHVVRGSVLLPKGTGRTVKVAVFVPDNQAADALAAGADIVGFETLANDIKNGQINFDILLATPAAMPLVGKLGPILGPRGLMPNPKLGTVTDDIITGIKNAKSGQISYKTDKAGIVHCPIGTVKFLKEDLKENLLVLIDALRRAKPSSSKGVYLKKITLSTTMGPGISIDISSVV